MDHAKAADIALFMIDKCGYNVDDLEAVDPDLDLLDPEMLWSRWQNNSRVPDERESALLSLLGTYMMQFEYFSLC